MESALNSSQLKMDAEKPFDYSYFWNEKDKREEKQIEKEVFDSKGKPRKGTKGRYLKPKNYISRRSSIRTMRTFAYKEKKIE